jgi:hypothetical protein
VQRPPGGTVTAVAGERNRGCKIARQQYRAAMAERDAPSVRERRLARELRLLREAAELHGKDVAERMGWSPSKVSRIETGRTGISSADLERLVELYQVPHEQAGFCAGWLPPPGRGAGGTPTPTPCRSAMRT